VGENLVNPLTNLQIKHLINVYFTHKLATNNSNNVFVKLFGNGNKGIFYGYGLAKFKRDTLLSKQYVDIYHYAFKH